ncbi:MAG: hypothetical protein NVV66_04885 [Cellulomonas sp.]|nr:hypothetical protein [Cellulomonas sp.]MCR6704038.1 hypothetical protein [Cellulomonas sp.]
MNDTLVLGGTGLLGYHTTLELLARGYAVSTLSLPLDGDSFLPEQVDAHWADVADLSDDEVLELLRGKHAVFYALGSDERVIPRPPQPGSSTRRTSSRRSASRAWPARRASRSSSCTGRTPRSGPSSGRTWTTAAATATRARASPRRRSPTSRATARWTS